MLQLNSDLVEKNLIFKMIRLKKIRHVIITAPSDNYNLFIKELQSLNTFNSMIFYYEINKVNEGSNKLDEIKVMKRINYIFIDGCI